MTAMTYDFASLDLGPSGMVTAATIEAHERVRGIRVGSGETSTAGRGADHRAAKNSIPLAPAIELN